MNPEAMRSLNCFDATVLIWRCMLRQLPRVVCVCFGKKSFLSLLLWCLSLSYSFAQVSGVTDLMIGDARKNLQESIWTVAGSKEKPEGIYESAFQKANACPNNDCAYEIYVSGLYDFVGSLGANRKCPFH